MAIQENYLPPITKIKKIHNKSLNSDSKRPIVRVIARCASSFIFIHFILPHLATGEPNVISIDF